jgi:hypothetical protein
VTAPQRGLQHGSDVLIRQVEGHLATLRVAPGPHDLTLAERLATLLRELVESTTRASAADRARVRAAVHYFVVRRRGGMDRRPARSLVEDLRVVHEIAHDLGRDDLLV